MTQNERLVYLIQYLLAEHQLEMTLPKDHDALFSLYRRLVNIREAKPVSPVFLQVHDAMLQEENRRKGIVDLTEHTEKLVVWRGDITRLKVDAIVNAANHQMEGCFIPEHTCIDNCIHTYAGIELRYACHELMRSKHYFEPAGQAIMTKGYQLPCRYILHTVGPMVQGDVTDKMQQELASCYRSCLELAAAYQLKRIAFCCISTGVFQFPRALAAQIAVSTVQKWLSQSGLEQVIFTVYTDADEALYRSLLSARQ